MSRPKSRRTQSRDRENCKPDSAFLVLDLRATYVRGLQLTDAALRRVERVLCCQVACFVMVFASIVEFAAVSYIGHIRSTAAASASTKNVNGAYNRLQKTTTLVDGEATAGRSAVVIVNRDASRRHETSRRHLSIQDTSSRNSASSFIICLPQHAGSIKCCRLCLRKMSQCLSCRRKHYVVDNIDVCALFPFWKQA